MPEFAGINSLFNVYGIDILSEKNISPKPPASPMGLEDYDTFAIAKREILKMKHPFALGLITISTHHPAGIFDERMKGKIPDRSSNLQFMMSALDYHIGDFMDFLKDQGIYDSTAVYIFPDHLLMNSSDNTKKLLQKTPRKLMMISNASASSFSKKTTEIIYQIDIPRLILDGAGVNTNALFLSDFLDGVDLGEFVERNKNNIVSLNNAALIREGASSSVALTIKKQGNKILLTTAGTTTTLKATPRYGYIINIGRYGTLKDLRRGYHADYTDYSRFIPSLYAYLDQGNLKLKLGSKVMSTQTEGTEQFINISKEALLTLREKPEVSAESQHKKAHPSLESEGIHIHSAGYMASKNSNIQLDNRLESLARGLSIITSRDDTFDIKSYDTYADKKEGKRFASTLAKSINQMNLVAIVASDDAAHSLTPEIRKKIYHLGLKKLAGIRFRDAYIGYFEHGNIVERRSMVEVTASLVAGERFNNSLTPSKASMIQDQKRFIAHAGGGRDLITV